MHISYGTGRRKSSVARVYLKKGKGNILINSKDWKSYFPSAAHQFKVNQPFNVCGLDNSFDMSVNVYGGGMTGQVEAIRLAVSRALCEVDENYRKMLKPLGLLTRDPRMVERKKFGQKKARKKFQFSKR